MMNEHFDAIVVGAGPSGNAAAYTMAKAGLSVLQIDRGEYPGSKNVQGAILYADALERIIPDFREDAPLERHVVEQRMWMLDEKSHTGAHYRSDEFNEQKPNRYTILRAQFDKWFSRKVREAGALLITETTVTSLVKNDMGKVIGVETDREGGPIFANVVVLAEGVNGLVGQRAGLRGELQPNHVALAVKETHFLSEEKVQERFNLHGEDDGVVIEVMGSVSSGMVGTGFLYTNKESISIGVGCLISDFAETSIAPYELLDRFKRHPSVAPLIKGSEMKEYVAHLIPEGGYNAIPELIGDGWMIVGDAGQFVNAVHREGSNLAMTTGDSVDVGGFGNFQGVLAVVICIVMRSENCLNDLFLVWLIYQDVDAVENLPIFVNPLVIDNLIGTVKGVLTDKGLRSLVIAGQQLVMRRP
jgi:electron transfer flavoprotein-quinone oxidoreductase